MHQLKRRHFLQLAGSTAASIGLSQSNLLGHVVRQGDRYGRVLAQDTPRKLALLVGINEYDIGFNWSPLRGCVNDVRMQEELLVHRFGFNRSDIVTLTDGDATRANVIKVFEEHLIQQANPGDVVVFHYSGHGSRVVDPHPIGDDPFNSTFVTIDSPLPHNFGRERVEVNDIMGQTLFLLMLSLQTEQVTAVLDSCHSGGGKRGVLTVRSRDGADIFANVYPSAVELDVQERLRSQLGLSWEDLVPLREQAIAKGVAIASARRDQLASDASFNGFYAGAFTYLLTQYLWQQTGNESVEATVSNISRITRTFAKDMSRIVQEPEFEENRPPSLESAPIYFIPRQAPPAEAVILGQKPNGHLEIWLGGLSRSSIETVNEAIFTAMDENGNEQGQLQVISRDGLTAEARFLGGTRSIPRPGLLLQEEIAGVPDDLSLRIGLDPSLGAEMAIAQQALAALPRLEVKLVEDGDVDYILGRMTPDYQAQQSPLLQTIPSVGSIGLFRPGQDVLKGSFQLPDESVTDAVHRLRSKFTVLLASRLLKILVNPGTSQVNVVASMRPVDANGAVATGTALTVRGHRSIADDDTAVTEPVVLSHDCSAEIPVDASRVPLGTVVELEVQNRERRDLYISIIVIDAEGNMALLFPNTWDASTASALVLSGETLKVPDPTRDNFRLRLVEPTGVVEVLVVASRTELRDTLQAIGEIATTRGASRGDILPADEAFLDIADSLLRDLDRDTRDAPSSRQVLSGNTRGSRTHRGGDRNTRSFAQEYVSSNTRGIGQDRLAVFSLNFELYDPHLGCSS